MRFSENRGMNNLILSLAVLISSACQANEIDGLKTREDIQLFLEQKVDAQFKKDPVFDKNAKMDTARYGDNTFFKIDFDNNRLTDLIVNGRVLMLVIDRGKNVYDWYILSGDPQFTKTYKLVSIDKTSSQKKIITDHPHQEKIIRDTFVYRFGGVIEYNSHPDPNFSFEKIIFQNGFDLSQKLTINSDRSASYYSLNSAGQSGYFHCIIPEKDFKEMVTLVRYINFDRLDSSYYFGGLDSEIATIQLWANGRTKTVKDYGKSGTFGLCMLYEKFIGWCESMPWELDQQ